MKLHFSRKSGLRWDLNLTHICAYVELALSIFPPCMQTIGEAKPLKTMPLVSADLTTVIYNQAVQKSWFFLIENFGVPTSYHLAKSPLEWCRGLNHLTGSGNYYIILYLIHTQTHISYMLRAPGECCLDFISWFVKRNFFLLNDSRFFFFFLLSKSGIACYCIELVLYDLFSFLFFNAGLSSMLIMLLMSQCILFTGKRNILTVLEWLSGFPSILKFCNLKDFL